MFTKKPEREGSGESRPLGERLSSEGARPFAERTPPKPAAPAASPVPSSSASSYSKSVPSIIGEDLTIVGNISSKGEIQVDGEIQGDVRCVSLLLGDKSRVKGGVVADDVVVRGTVHGSIRGLRVTLQAQSHVEGDIYHQSLAIEQGAYFEGKSRRSEDPVSVPKQEEPAKAEDSRPAKTSSFERPAESRPEASSPSFAGPGTGNSKPSAAE